MQERGWVVKMLRWVGFLSLVVAVVGLVVLIWGMVSPGWFRMLGRPIGLRPAGLVLIAEGLCGGLLFLGMAEIIGLLGAIARRP
jgi:hypothetical protein